MTQFPEVNTGQRLLFQPSVSNAGFSGRSQKLDSALVLCNIYVSRDLSYKFVPYMTDADQMHYTVELSGDKDGEVTLIFTLICVYCDIHFQHKWIS